MGILPLVRYKIHIRQGTSNYQQSLFCFSCSGYDGVIKCLMRELPSGTVSHNHPVRCVHWNDTAKADGSVIIECESGERIVADHVLVTVPLGRATYERCLTGKMALQLQSPSVMIKACMSSFRLPQETPHNILLPASPSTQAALHSKTRIWNQR